MSQSGYTPILIYASGTATNVPLAANLTSSASGAELALNYADGKLYYKNSSGVVTLLAGSGGGGPAAGSNTQIQFNNSGVFGASANLTWSGTVLATTGLTATGAILHNTTTNNQSYTTTGAGTITISSGTTGTIDGMSIGATTAAAATFTNLTYTGTLTGSTGVIAIGTNQIYKDSSGNVGIGTSSPTAYGGYTTLEVGGTAGLFSAKHANGNALMYNSSGNAVFGSTAAYATIFNTNSVERMRIDSNGIVGVGATPSAWGSFKAIDIGPSGAIANYTGTNPGSVGIYCNFYWDGSNYKYKYTGAVTSFSAGTDGIFYWFNAASGAAGTTFSLTERMRLDANGNLGIGTSSPTASTRLTLSDTNPSKLVITGGTNQNGMLLNAVSTASQYYIGAGKDLLVGGDKGIIIYDVTNARAKFYVEDTTGETRTLATTFLSYYTGGSERMRIDSSGRLALGASSAYGNAKITLIPATNPTSGLSTNSQIQIGESSNNSAYGLNVGYGLISGDYYGYIQSKNNSLASSLLLNPDGGNVIIGNPTTLGAKFGLYGTSAGTNNYIQITNSGYGTACIGLGATSSNVKFYNCYTSGTLATGVGIDIDSSGNLIVGGTSNIYGAGISNYGGFVVTRNTGATAGKFWNCPYVDTNNTVYVINQNNAGVYIPDGGLAWVANSDERLKDIIEPITDAANKVSTIRAVIGKFKTDADGTRRSFLIAQDVQAVLPEAVTSSKLANSEDNTEYLGLAYTEVIPLLVAAIKEQQAVITSLTARITALESKG